MNRVLFVTPLIFTLLFMATVVPSFTGTVLGKGRITEITLERTACQGPCPVYKVVFRDDGTVTYLGKAHVERTGEYQGQIHPSVFMQLAELFESQKFHKLKNSYSKPVTDTPGVITSVVRDSKRVTVSNHSGAGPIKLWGMEMAVDAVVAEVEWKRQAIGMQGKPPLTTTKRYDDISEIQLERTRCYGTCPVYTVVLRRDGTATYAGEAYVERKGQYRGEIHPSTFLQLARLLSTEGFFDLEDSYTKPVTDSPSAIITVVRGDERKRVSNYADAGPPGLWGMEMAVDAVVAQMKWKKAEN